MFLDIWYFSDGISLMVTEKNAVLMMDDFAMTISVILVFADQKQPPGLRPATFLKKGLWRGCFPMNFAKFLRTPFLQNTSRRLLFLLLKKRLWHKCFLVNFAKFIRTPFLKEHLWWRLICKWVMVLSFFGLYPLWYGSVSLKKSNC